METKNTQSWLFSLLIIIALGASIYLYFDSKANIKEENARWEQISGKTYTSDSKEEIYITTKKNELSSLENETVDTHYMNHHYSMILNSKTNDYRNPEPFILDIFGQLEKLLAEPDTVYLVKKDNGTLSGAESTINHIYDEREDKNANFTVTIKRFDDQYRVYLKNTKKEYKEYNSDGLP